MQVEGIQIRPYRDGDLPAVVHVYREAVRRSAASFYSAEQIRAWSQFPEDLRALHRRFRAGHGLIACQAHQIAAFALLEPLDHVALLYTHPDFARRGCATALYQELEAYARQRQVHQLLTEASQLSHPLFARLGFQVLEEEEVKYSGIAFSRYRMGKQLDTREPLPCTS